MMNSFALDKSTPEVVEKHLGMKPEEFDKKFIGWLETQNRKTLEGYEGWRKRFTKLHETAKGASPDDIIKEGMAIRDMYPDYVEAGSVYEMLADAYTAKGDKIAAMRQLERYSSVGGRSPELLMKLAALQVDAGNKNEAAYTLQRLNLIYPIGEELHRKLGDLWQDTGNLNGAIMEYQAVLASKPLDQATTRFNLARALRSANRTEDAREQLLLALESAPGYKPAQRMLLEISK
jgi:tetratricopeptide (TPR) repeat protein